MMTINEIVLDSPTRVIVRRSYWAEAVYVQAPITVDSDLIHIHIDAGDATQELTNNCCNAWASELLPDGD